MNLSFSSNAFRFHTLPETFGVLAGLGYRGVEIMADVPHAWPPDLTPGAVEALRSELKRRHLRAVNVNAFTMQAVGDTWTPSWIDPDPAARRRRLDHPRRCQELAARLGAPHISTEPGGALPPGMSRADALALFREGLLEVAPTARDLGLRVLIEPEPGLLLETSAEFAAFHRDLDPEVFGLNFDVGHFFCVGEDPAQIARSLGKAIRHVHLEDIAADRRHVHLIPGEGAIDFRGVCAALDEVGYDGYLTVELYTCADRPAEAAERSLRFLRRALAQGTA